VAKTDFESVADYSADHGEGRSKNQTDSLGETCGAEGAGQKQTETQKKYALSRATRIDEALHQRVTKRMLR
jgi:hypothetical protein